MALSVVPGAGNAVGKACRVFKQCMSASAFASMDNFGTRPAEYFSTISTILDTIHGKKAKDMTSSELQALSRPALRELEMFLEKFALAHSLIWLTVVCTSA